METWFIYAILTCIVTSLSVIGMKYITNSSTDIISCIMIVYVLVGLLALLYLLFFKRNCIDDLKNNFYPIIILGFLGILTGVFIMKSFENNNINPGYIQLIVNTNVILTLILSYYIFNIKMNYNTVLGSIIAITGIFIVVKYSNV